MGSFFPILPIITAVLGVALIVLLARSLKKLERRRATEVMKKFEGAQLLGFSSNANFMGHTSAGTPGMRGNSVMLLTVEELYFELWKPQRSLSVPVQSIVRTAKVRSFKGRSKGVPMIQVDFEGASGTTDSCAFIVRNPETWMRALSKLSA